MDLINNFILSIDEAGLRTDVYSTINTIALVVAILFGFLHGMKLKVGIISVVVAIAVDRILSGPLATAILFVEDGFVSTGRANGVVVFPFVPLIGFLVSKVLRKSYKEIWDIMMVVPLTMFAGARIACTIAGCCRGYLCVWGVYNAKVGQILFPIQLLESFVAILILVFVILREKKNKFIPDGRNVPFILISYGVCRFFLEFLHDNVKTVLGLASTQFHCLVMILVGVITLVIINQSEKRKEQTLVQECAKDLLYGEGDTRQP